MERYHALEHDPDGIYRLAELVLQRVEWLLSQPDAPSRLRGVYLASITASSINHYAPDTLLTSAIFDVYIYFRIELVPLEDNFDSQTRDGVISNCSTIFATDDLVRNLQFYDLLIKNARSANAMDMALYGKACALGRAQHNKEAIEVWSQIRDDGQAGWMKKRNIDFLKRNFSKEQTTSKKH